MQFDLSLRDYNFDGVNDVKIQELATNGYSLSYGRMLTFANDNLVLHEEVLREGDLMPDFNTKTVTSLEVIYCEENGERKACKKTFKWEKQKLVQTRIDCPCTPQEQYN